MNEILSFALVALLLVISPGPNGVLIIKTVSSHGRSAAFANIIGLTAATFFHGAFSILGLSALVLHSAEAFMLIKVIGAAYLFYIGTKAIIASFKNVDITVGKVNSGKVQKRKKHLGCFCEGFINQILNPKASMFYLAAFPQFISIDQASYFDAFRLVAIHASMIFVWFVGMAMTLNKMKSVAKPSLGKWIQRLSGTIMINFSFLIVTQTKT